jgi:hypothetical protein
MSSFTWIGAITKDIGLCIAWGATPFKTIDDAKKQQMVVAGTGAGSETDTWPLVLNDVMDAEGGRKGAKISSLYTSVNTALCRSCRVSSRKEVKLAEGPVMVPM